MTNSWTTIARYVLLAIIWIGVFAVTGMMVGFAEPGDTQSGAIGFGAYFGAAIATGFILYFGRLDRLDSQQQRSVDSTEQSKRKNDQRFDPLDLLTDEDIAELREDIKQRLRERILSGEDGELGSLDALLSDHEERVAVRRSR